MRPRRLPTIVLAALHLTACVSWQRTDLPLPVLLEEERPDVIRLAHGDEVAGRVRYPWIVGDSVYSVEPECRTTGEPWTCSKVPAAAVAEVEAVVWVDVERFDLGKTILGVIIPAGIAAYCVYIFGFHLAF
jgi:hypothetical protein